MKRLITILLLMFLPTAVMAEEIVLTCKNRIGREDVLRIDLESNKVDVGAEYGPPIDIYFINDKYIMWIGNSMDIDDVFSQDVSLVVLYRRTGEVRLISYHVPLEARTMFGEHLVNTTVWQCFKSF